MKVHRSGCDVCKDEFVPPMLGFKNLAEVYTWDSTEFNGPGGAEENYKTHDLCHPCAIKRLQLLINKQPDNLQERMLLKGSI